MTALLKQNIFVLMSCPLFMLWITLLKRERYWKQWAKQVIWFVADFGLLKKQSLTF